MNVPYTRVYAQISVADHMRSVAWYGRLFGRKPDSTPMDGLAEWQITHTGWLQVFADADAAGTSTATIGVDDLDRHFESVGGLDLVDIERQTTPRGQRIAIITDPGGNTIVFAQDFPDDRLPCPHC